jgi:hypothetical protein
LRRERAARSSEVGPWFFNHVHCERLDMSMGEFGNGPPGYGVSISL